MQQSHCQAGSFVLLAADVAQILYRAFQVRNRTGICSVRPPPLRRSALLSGRLIRPDISFPSAAPPCQNFRLAGPVVAADAAVETELGVKPGDVLVAPAGDLGKAANALGVQHLLQLRADTGDQLEIIGLRSPRRRFCLHDRFWLACRRRLARLDRRACLDRRAGGLDHRQSRPGLLLGSRLLRNGLGESLDRRADIFRPDIDFRCRFLRRRVVESGSKLAGRFQSALEGSEKGARHLRRETEADRRCCGKGCGGMRHQRMHRHRLCVFQHLGGKTAEAGREIGSLFLLPNLGCLVRHDYSAASRTAP
ncbi:hypothetical protein RHECNPAF_8900124 [Rhizobium etli CNPAF512]|nr:hypothetical protein RHECNPAF_8900124 [Rhizobium etli CNPAF512]